MSGLEPLGRSLVVLGLALAALGAVFILGPRVPFLGRLPGDLRLERDGLVVYLPFASMVLVSVVASLVLWLLGRR